MQVSDEEVWCECSDDEMYNPGKLKKGTWQPKSEDILKIFDEVKAKKVLELSWKCPGRRHPDTDVKPEEDVKVEEITTPKAKEEQRPSIPNEFDFDDDAPDSRTMFNPRRTPGTTPKSEKKVARMDKVLKDMMQQRKIQAAEREARKLAKASRTPNSPGRARIGSPAGSPRTPPSAGGSNRHSPVRAAVAPPTSDPYATTPLRAPIDSHNTPQRQAQNEPNKNRGSSPSLAKGEPGGAAVSTPVSNTKTTFPPSNTNTNVNTSQSQQSVKQQSQIDTQMSMFSQTPTKEPVGSVQSKETSASATAISNINTQSSSGPGATNTSQASSHSVSKPSQQTNTTKESAGASQDKTEKLDTSTESMDTT